MQLNVSSGEPLPANVEWVEWQRNSCRLLITHCPQCNDTRLVENQQSFWIPFKPLNTVIIINHYYYIIIFHLHVIIHWIIQHLCELSDTDSVVQTVSLLNIEHKFGIRAALKLPSANKQDRFVLRIQSWPVIGLLAPYRSTLRQRRRVIDASRPLWFIPRNI